MSQYQGLPDTLILTFGQPIFNIEHEAKLILNTGRFYWVGL